MYLSRVRKKEKKRVPLIIKLKPEFNRHRHTHTYRESQCVWVIILKSEVGMSIFFFSFSVSLQQRQPEWMNEWNSKINKTLNNGTKLIQLNSKRFEKYKRVLKTNCFFLFVFCIVLCDKKNYVMLIQRNVAGNGRRQNDRRSTKKIKTNPDWKVCCTHSESLIYDK